MQSLWLVACRLAQCGAAARSAGEALLLATIRVVLEVLVQDVRWAVPPHHCSETDPKAVQAGTAGQSGLRWRRGSLRYYLGNWNVHGLRVVGGQVSLERWAQREQKSFYRPGARMSPMVRSRAGSLCLLR